VTDEAVDGGIHRRKLVASSPRYEQRHIPSKIRKGVCSNSLEPLQNTYGTKAFVDRV
jgi:hypothetical protein